MKSFKYIFLFTTIFTTCINAQAPVANYDGNLPSGSTLVLDTIDSNTYGWTNQKLTNGTLEIGSRVSIIKTFSFGSAHANQSVLLELIYSAKDTWEKANDSIRIAANGVLTRIYYGNAGDRIYSKNSTLNSNGSLTVNIRAQTNAANKQAFLKQIKITTNSAWVDTNYNKNEDTTITMNVLSNDTDRENDTLSIVKINSTNIVNSSTNVNIKDSTNTTIGVANIVLNKIVFTPNSNLDKLKKNEVNEYSFTYQISDNNGGSSSSSVTMQITGVNDAPTISNFDSNASVSININENEDFSLDYNALDVDNDASRTFTITGTDASYFTIVTSNGMLSLKNQANYENKSSYVISIKVTDEYGASDVQEITLNITDVNEAPIFETNPRINVVENDLYSYTPIVSDVDANPSLSITALIKPTWLSFNGTTLTGTPNVAGNYAVSLKVSDGILTDTQNFTILVSNINDAPILDAVSIITSEDAIVNSVLGTISGNDEEGDAISYTIVSGDENSNFAIGNTSGIITLAKTLNTNEKSRYDLSVRVSDINSASSLGTVTILVTDVVHSPIALADEASIDEDTNASINLVNNDSDSDNNLNPSNVEITKAPLNGSVNVDINGTALYIPSLNYNGNDYFTYRVYDSTSLASNEVNVSISINPINDAPVTISIVENSDYNASEDSNYSSSLIPYAYDVDGNNTIVSYTLIDDSLANGNITVESNGTFLYEPSPNFYGVSKFTFEVSDGNLSSNISEVLINVAEVNDIPIAQDDNVTLDEDSFVNINILDNDSDDGDLNISSISIIQTPLNGNVSIELNGSVTYTPNENFFGLDNFRYRVNDDGLVTASLGGVGVLSSNGASVTITVNNINDIPIANNDNIILNEDTFSLLNLHANDTDIESDLNGTAIRLQKNPSNGTLTQEASGFFRYIPNINFFGTDSFTYKISDGTIYSNEANVSITVNSINDIALINADTFTTNEDISINMNILANDSNLDGNLTKDSIAIDSQTINGNISITNNGLILYTPNENFHGNDRFTYHLVDEDLNTSTVDVDIIIISVNDAPIVENINNIVKAENFVPFNIMFNASDADDDSLKYEVSISDDTIINVTRNNNILMFTPRANTSGIVSVEISAMDDTLSSSVSFDIEIVNYCSEVNNNESNSKNISCSDNINKTNENTNDINISGNLNFNKIDESNNTIINIDNPKIDINLSKKGTFTVNTNQSNGSHSIEVNNKGTDVNINENGISLLTPSLINNDSSTCKFDVSILGDGSIVNTKHTLGQDSLDDIITNIIVKIPNASVEITSENIVEHIGKFKNSNALDVEVRASVNCQGEVTTITKIGDSNSSYVALNKAGSTVIIDIEGNVDTSIENGDNSSVKSLNFKINSLDGNITTTKILDNNKSEGVTYPIASKLVSDGIHITVINVKFLDKYHVSVELKDDTNKTITTKTTISDEFDIDDINRTSEGKDGKVSTSITTQDSSTINIDNFVNGEVVHKVLVGINTTQALSKLVGSEVNVSKSGVVTSYKDDETLLSISADNNGTAIHKVVQFQSEITTEAIFNIAGANTIMEKINDLNTIVTKIQNDDKNIEVRAFANGEASHEVKTSSFTTTVQSKIKGAKTIVSSTSNVQTSVEQEVKNANENYHKIVVTTDTNGTSTSKIIQYNSLGDILNEERTISSEFEADNKITLENVNGSMIIDIKTNLNKQIEF